MMHLWGAHRTGGRLGGSDGAGNLGSPRGVRLEPTTIVRFYSLTVSPPTPVLRPGEVGGIGSCPSDSGRASASGLAFSVLESPAHRCCALERPTMWSNRCREHWSLLPISELPQVDSGGVVPAATFTHRPGDGLIPARAW